MASSSGISNAKAAEVVEEESWDYHQKDEQDWALTYNVWHMLPWMERKQMANRYGCKTIGEFEEFMSMKRALEEETTNNEKKQQQSNPYPNEQAYPFLKSDKSKEEEQKPAAIQEDDDDEEDEEDSSYTASLTVAESRATTPEEELSDDELVRVGGLFLSIPEELCHHIFAYLGVEAYAILALVSPHWKHLTRTETVYKVLCERIYLQQSKRRALHVSRFGNSYRAMLYTRPRVRNGLYVMKYSKVSDVIV